MWVDLVSHFLDSKGRRSLQNVGVSWLGSAAVGAHLDNCHLVIRSEIVLMIIKADTIP